MAQPNDLAPSLDGKTRAEMIRQILDGNEALMHRLSGMHAPEFLEIGITMPQAKALYLVSASSGIHMSELAARLGVTLSTVSGLVDRLVESGLVSRRDDPADRRQVVVDMTDTGRTLVERFRELNESMFVTLLHRLDDGDLRTIVRAIDALIRAAAAADAPT